MSLSHKGAPVPCSRAVDFPMLRHFHEPYASREVFLDPRFLEDGRRPLVACFDTPDFRFSILFQHLIGRCIKKVNLDGLGQLQEREEDTIRRNSGGPTVGTLERKRITRAGPRRYSSQIQTEDVGPFCKFFRKFSFLSHARSQLRSHLENYLRKVTSR